MIRIILLGIALMCVSCASNLGSNNPNWHPSDMSLADYRAHLARMRTDPNEPSLVDSDQPDYADRMANIDATHAPACGICDPITRKSPDGTYTLPPRNR